MKKVIAILLALVMVLGLAGCTNGEPSTYKLGDIYAMSNVLREIPYEIGHWDSIQNKWVVSNVLLLKDVLSMEQSRRVIYDDAYLYNEYCLIADDLNGFEFDYYLRGKTITELNTYVSIYYNALKKNENVVDEDFRIGDINGEICYGMILSPEASAPNDSDKVYAVEIGASTYDSTSGLYSDAPYLYVMVTETSYQCAYAWLYNLNMGD